MSAAAKKPALPTMSPAILKLAAASCAAAALAVFWARRTPCTVRVEREFGAPVEKVWALWSDAESMKKWWGPKNYASPSVRSDFRVGGAYVLAMRAPDGTTHWNGGRYVDIVPNRRISSTMSFADENGRPLRGKDVPAPGVWPDEVTVTVEFKAAGGGTSVSIEETGIPVVMMAFAKMGWEQQFDKMEKLLK